MGARLKLCDRPLHGAEEARGESPLSLKFQDVFSCPGVVVMLIIPVIRNVQEHTARVVPEDLDHLWESGNGCRVLPTALRKEIEVEMTAMVGLHKTGGDDDARTEEVLDGGPVRGVRIMAGNRGRDLDGHLHVLKLGFDIEIL